MLAKSGMNANGINLSKGKHVTQLTSIGFWNGVTSCLKVFAPLVRVLCIVDGDRKPLMGFVYGELLQAKDDIKVAISSYPKNYEYILTIIDAKMKDRLDTLHLSAFLLNPYYHYKDPNLILDKVVSDGIIDFLDNFLCDDFEMMNTVINVKLPIYKTKGEAFRRAIAAKGCQENNV